MFSGIIWWKVYPFYPTKFLKKFSIVRCIPFRYRKSDEGGEATSEKIVEVLMINSPSGPGLLFPKVYIILYFNIIHSPNASEFEYYIICYYYDRCECIPRQTNYLILISITGYLYLSKNYCTNLVFYWSGVPTHIVTYFGINE